MSNTKTEAQRLASVLDSDEFDLSVSGRKSAAAELRSLDAQNKAMHKIIDQLRTQLAKAVAEEREACAGICDRFQARNVGMQPAECAAAIRARSNT